ncbi:thiopeptide-type bacteriocin biosynthesis protein [Chryseobacterium rhizosphaerae]|uniref:thiopeptide-type bacteriocin biosynthesis protein n=1 Tax=Chryseobacterium rhizosphaerae TaxID=395937 RepID=UPI002358EE1E|nr:thiopeptide-type bacteriocin biosynthesis protein [Chryseobacterium rhizosphaerae]MDC8101637.1 thiopeptide-type bacteriocin biosynthesis protein [Chryseobacterium rhizosphaerae]
MMIKRKFVPGSEWLYFKIYTGIKTADIILEESIEPLVAYFKENNLISQWFFIRYSDPNPHLRLRFKLTQTENYTDVLQKVNTTLTEYTNSGEISNILIDIYNREIERYGSNTIEEAETLFWNNSEFTLQCLHYTDEEKLIISLFYIDELLNQLNLPIQEKLNWIKDFNEVFKKEFNAGKKLNSQQDKKYREFNPQLLDFIQSEEFSEERNTIISTINESASALQTILNHHENEYSESSPQTFFQSIFHMNINRMFISNQRLFEMIVYDYLFRYYKTVAFRAL